MLLRALTNSRERPKWDEKPANWHAAPETRSLSLQALADKNLSKFNEQSRNVLENKGPVRKACGSSGNLIENKGTNGL